MSSTEVILVNLGTPAAPTAPAVRAFLEEFLSDPMVVDYPAWFWQPVLRRLVLRSRPAKVAELYRSIWSDAGSPLKVGTLEMVAGLAGAVDDDVRVTYAFRYGSPSIEEALRTAGERAQRILVTPLFPQRTGSTTGSILKEVDEAGRRLGLTERIETRLLAPDDPGYVDALARRVEDALAGAAEPPDRLLISFHGIPRRYDRAERGQYQADCRRTADALVERLAWDRDRATLTYQSKFGPEPWIKPATATVLEQLPLQGVHRVAVLTPGFLTEGLETLEEIAERGRESFLSSGGQEFKYVPAAGNHPALIQSLARLLQTSVVND